MAPFLDGELMLELVGALNKAAGTTGLGGPAAASRLATRTVRAGRAGTGAVAGTGQSDVTFVWSSPFDDDAYTVHVTVEQDTAGDGLRVRRVRSRTASQVVVNVQNTALGSTSGTLHVIAVHD